MIKYYINREVKIMLKVVVNKDTNKIKQQIQALEWQITQDTNLKDREIHLQALKALKQALHK